MAMPAPVMGKDISLTGIFDANHKRYAEAAEVRALYEADPQVKQIIDTARGLEGLKRQWGVHAAVVIMSSEPLIDIIPIQRRDSDGAIITQFDMGACETLGLLKMDFLGLRNLTVIDPELAEPLADILDETFGLIVYQEQVMAIAQRVAGYSLGKADLLRRAMGKKKKEILDKEYETFSGGMRDAGYSTAAIKTLWDILDFTAVGDDIRFGLGAVRNVGGNVVDAITRARTEKGAYTDFSDFLRKVDAVAYNRKVVESLIKAGAFDSLGHPCKGLYLVHGEAIDAVMESKRAEAIGQFDLFGSQAGAGCPFTGPFELGRRRKLILVGRR